MVYVVSWALCQILGVAQHFVLDPGGSLVETLCRWNLVLGVGFFGLFNFVGHAILSRRVAAGIGWVSNGFQRELGFISLGIGLDGVLCYWFRDGLWLGTTVVVSCFLLGAAGLHVHEWVRSGNRHAGNTWIILPDVLIPATLITLLALR
jgi:hypothetical protein